MRAWPWTAAPTVTATATEYVLARSDLLTRVPLNVQDPLASAVHVCFCRASIAFSDVETSVGKDGGVVAGADSAGV
jgi:hypothetical protein